MDGEFVNTKIDLFYYTEFAFKNISTKFSYSNEEKPIMIETDFKWGKGNDYEQFRRYGNFTCRFMSTTTDPPIQVIVPAVMETSPIGAYLPQQEPNQIRCRTPKWNNTEVVNLEVSANGFDYMGNFQMTIVENLKALKISPMAGPIEGGTKVKLYGYGFSQSIPKEQEVHIRFGTIETQVMDKSGVEEQVKWNDDGYHDELNIPKGLLQKAEANDVKIEDDTALRSYSWAVAPDISKSYSKIAPDVRSMGGPVYIQLSEKIPTPSTIHQFNTVSSNKKRLLSSGANTYTEQIETVYSDSSNAEFYYYRSPFVKKVEPSSGLAQGGTLISITGAWFQYYPEYGVMPFCRIGDVVSRATFVQTNRILCKTPPTNETALPVPISVSLNGVDFVDSNFTFNYYEKPILLDI